MNYVGSEETNYSLDNVWIAYLNGCWLDRRYTLQKRKTI